VQSIMRKKFDSKEAREKELEALGPPPTEPPEIGLLLDDATIEGVYRHLKSGRVSQGLFSSEGGCSSAVMQ
jgi:hypothetical protein